MEADTFRGGEWFIGTVRFERRAGRGGSVPRTGKEIQIKASQSPAFRAGKGLKEAI